MTDTRRHDRLRLEAQAALGLTDAIWETSRDGHYLKGERQSESRARVCVWLRERRLSYPQISRAVGMCHSSVMAAVAKWGGVMGDTTGAER